MPLAVALLSFGLFGLGAQFPAPLGGALFPQSWRFQAAPSAQGGERFSGARGTARPITTQR
ncbi:hypothetical protein SBRY_10656 [Actinacidiphila bryophytorum]|uniref:Uncharacterized protein n=1 Tax=Actinacidiphila bryophytorum TaxID=1436133 RepID=A0A9W4E3D0_9ACTN|nr:hypothetical protein SBRY_10656 [Actinacidiphila bryophytorum]